MSRTTLVIVCGLPGSGKTTLARELAEELPAVRFDPDEWLADLQISPWDDTTRARVETLQWKVAEDLLRSGTSVIVEWGTWAREERDRLRTRARALGARVELRVLDAHDAELFGRISRRAFEDPPVTMQQVQAWRRAFEVPTDDERALYDDTEPPPVLVVIRGNAASGKSTLADNLQRSSGRGVARIGQDHLRRELLREHDVPGGDNIELIRATAEHCLRLGYHVIVEGILFSGHYAAMLRHLMTTHRGPTHVFYLDVSLDETLVRHAGRALSADVSADRLRDWYLDKDLIGVEGEIVLDARVPPQQLLESVQRRIGPLSMRPDAATTARFL